jgi:hypothetical protein
MIKLLGLLLVLAGIFLGLYVGIYVCLIGGIIKLIVACKAATIVPSAIAWPIARILCAGLLGYLSAVFPLAVGAVMIKEG